MSRFPVTLGRCLKSVALRYRQPNCWLERSPRVALPHLGQVQAAPHPDEGEGSSRPVRIARLEAILFLSREPLGSRKLAQLAGLADGTKARTLVRALNRRYDAEGSAFRVEEVAGGFQLLTRPSTLPGSVGCTQSPSKYGFRPRPWKPWRSSPIDSPYCGPKSKRSAVYNVARSFASSSNATWCESWAGLRNWGVRYYMERLGNFCRFSGYGTWRIYLDPSFCRLRSLSPRIRANRSPILPRSICNNFINLARCKRRPT